MADIQSATAEIRRGKKKRKKKEEETTRQKHNCLPFHWATIMSVQKQDQEEGNRKLPKFMSGKRLYTPRIQYSSAK